MDPAADRCGDIYKCIQRETRNAAAKKIIYAWLSDSAMFRRLNLSPATFFDDSRYLLHKFRSSAQIRRFFGSIRYSIPNASVAFDLTHFLPFIN